MIAQQTMTTTQACPALEPTQFTDELRRRILRGPVLPALTAPLAGVLLAYAWIVPNLGVAGRAIQIGAPTLLFLAALRQMLAVWETARLYDCAGSAYRELKQTHEQTTGHASRIAELNGRLRLVQQELVDNNRALSEANARLADLATTDGMTGLANHRAFQEGLRAALAEAREGQRVSLLMIDVDNFKQYNDNFGHPAGDDVLRIIGRHIRRLTSGSQLAARYGGEEFAVLLPESGCEHASEIAEAIRSTVASYRFPYRRVTLSIGVAHYPDDASDAESLIKRSDSALYVAKRSGKDRVAHAGDRAMEARPPDPEYAASTRVEALFQASFINGDVEADLQMVDTIIAEDKLITALMAALDLRDAETEFHSRRVAVYSLRLAHAAMAAGLLNLDDSSLKHVAIGALLHDIGKIGLPDSILFKSGPLTQDETDLMRRHPELGARLLQTSPGLSGAIPIVLHHHERWDGNGYPYRLSGYQIPIIARIFSLADTLDAMTTDRPYRPRLALSSARAEVQRLAGTQFDPELARLFLSIPEREWTQLRGKQSSDRPNPPAALPERSKAA
jgi:diguanylate cyclase (GGDEF)-like protein